MSLINLTTRRLVCSAVATAAAALAAAPSVLAATPRALGSADGGAAMELSAPFTIGLSSRQVPAGGKVTIAGLANARAGTTLTISSKAISSARTVNGIPSVRTPALVEGTYKTTVLIGPATRPGTYAVVMRVANRQVASTSLRVVARNTQPVRPTGRLACAGISFTVLHNDRSGGLALPAGGYRITSPNLDCGTASADFTTFLNRYNGAIPGWNATQRAAGEGTFTQRGTGSNFTVTHNR